jgi:hypothetical protein
MSISLSDPVPLNRLISVGLPWFHDKIAKHSTMASIKDPQGNPWDFQLWVLWAMERGFLYLWPDPPTLGLIGRPVTRGMVLNWASYPPEDLLYVYDQSGDGIWIDFLWAPGQYNIVMKFLRMTNKRWVGWQHRVTQAPHIQFFHDMREKVH